MSAAMSDNEAQMGADLSNHVIGKMITATKDVVDIIGDNEDMVRPLLILALFGYAHFVCSILYGVTGVEWQKAIEMLMAEIKAMLLKEPAPPLPPEEEAAT